MVGELFRKRGIQFEKALKAEVIFRMSRMVSEQTYRKRTMQWAFAGRGELTVISEDQRRREVTWDAQKWVRVRLQRMILWKCKRTVGSL